MTYTMENLEEYFTALELIRKKKFSELLKNKDILKLADEEGWTIAHEMAMQGFRFDPDKHKDILKLVDTDGWTVAHVMARYGGFWFDPEKYQDILKWTEMEGYTVAHVMASIVEVNKHHFNITKHKYREFFGWTDENGWTIAHETARHGYLFNPDEDKDILRGWRTKTGGLWHMSRPSRVSGSVRKDTGTS